MDLHTEKELKRAVEDAGALWCGVQETIPPEPDLLLFNSPTTDTTLAVRLHVNEFNESSRAALTESIRAKIQKSDAQFENRKVLVPIEALQDISETLLSLSRTLESLCQTKSQGRKK